MGKMSYVLRRQRELKNQRNKTFKENVLCIKKTDVYLEGIKLKSSADVVTIKDVTSTWDKVLKYGYMALSEYD